MIFYIIILGTEYTSRSHK